MHGCEQSEANSFFSFSLSDSIQNENPDSAQITSLFLVISPTNLSPIFIGFLIYCFYCFIFLAKSGTAVAYTGSIQ
jgi:hypothetical protein